MSTNDVMFWVLAFLAAGVACIAFLAWWGGDVE